MEILSQIPIWKILAGAGLLVVVVGIWFLVERLANPTYGHAEDPTVTASLTGVCGDTMEVTLKIRDGRVASAGYWASGCGPSSACGAMATKLAVGKTPDEAVETVDAAAIEEAVGGLPEDKRHCAQLAAETLQEAVHRYYLSQRKRAVEKGPSVSRERTDNGEFHKGLA